MYDDNLLDREEIRGYEDPDDEYVGKSRKQRIKDWDYDRYEGDEAIEKGE